VKRKVRDQGAVTKSFVALVIKETKKLSYMLFQSHSLRPSSDISLVSQHMENSLSDQQPPAQNKEYQALFEADLRCHGA
jgi:hypothetical protein